MKCILNNVIALFWLVFSASASAHAFDEKYDLPLPINYFLWGATLSVGLTYLLAIVFLKSPQFEKLGIRSNHQIPISLRKYGFLQFLLPLRIVILLLLLLLVSIGFTGPQNPLMNLIPHLLWVNWWIGMPLLFLLLGNTLQRLSPIEFLFDGVNSLFKNSLKPLLTYPMWLGCWPATLLLLFWCWVEVIYPNAALPFYISIFVIAWLGICLISQLLFGKEVTRRNIDFFSIYFSYFGLTSVFQWSAKDNDQVTIGKPFTGLLKSYHVATPGSVGFIIAMLSAVLFDGLHGSSAWQYYDHFLQQNWPKFIDVNGYRPGALGVFLVWFILYLSYLVSCYLNFFLAKIFYPTEKVTFESLLRNFAPTLVPIAIAYLIAHNFSSLVLQGQNFIPLLSDPYQLGWNLFGTADFKLDITLLDAKTTWYVAITSIVLGHIFSIWLCHLKSLELYSHRVAASISTLPLSLVMIFYTVLSLLVLAEPLVNSA